MQTRKPRPPPHSALSFLFSFYKMDIKFTLYLRPRSSSSGLPYCYDGLIEKSEEIVLMQQRSTCRFERAKLVYKAALRDERRQPRMSLQNVKMTVMFPYRKH